MFEVAQRGESLAHDAMIATPGEVGHKRHPAGVVLVGGVIQPRCPTSAVSEARSLRKVVSGHEDLPVVSISPATRIGTTWTHLRLPAGYLSGVWSRYHFLTRGPATAG
jgi:hypothetical protein